MIEIHSSRRGRVTAASARRCTSQRESATRSSDALSATGLVLPEAEEQSALRRPAACPDSSPSALEQTVADDGAGDRAARTRPLRSKASLPESPNSSREDRCRQATALPRPMRSSRSGQTRRSSWTRPSRPTRCWLSNAWAGGPIDCAELGDDGPRLVVPSGRGARQRADGRLD